MRTTDAHHTCCNQNSRHEPLEDTIVCEHTCRNCVHADRSDWLNSYGTFQPMGPNLRRSCTMECRKHITKRSCRQSCLFTASSISCRCRLCSGISNTLRKHRKCLHDRRRDDTCSQSCSLDCLQPTPRLCSVCNNKQTAAGIVATAGGLCYLSHPLI